MVDGIDVNERKLDIVARLYTIMNRQVVFEVKALVIPFRLVRAVSSFGIPNADELVQQIPSS
jgi:hypothetical protein